MRGSNKDGLQGVNVTDSMREELSLWLAACEGTERMRNPG